jgi:dienelactone hydrolase
MPAPIKESPRTFTGRAAELAAQAKPPQRSADDADLRQRMKNAAIAERTEWQKVKTRSDWEMFRDQRIAALRKSLGPFPERTPSRPAVTRRIDTGEGFVIENVVYESMPGRLVPANLYLPSTTSTARIPAIVVAHSHHAPKTQSELQDMGMTWARAGIAVLVPDQPGAGERVESQAWPREGYYSRYAMSMQLYLAGESLMKWMVWDLMRGIDLLLTRPRIDPQRIVMLGAVAGGGDPAAVTAALDSRIAAVIPFNFGEAGPEEHYTEGPRPYDSETADPGWGYWESTRNLHRSAADQFFPWLICASVAPRPFLFSFEIGWPKTVEEEPMWARYKKVFELYGKRENLASVDGFGPFPGPGECTNVGSFLRRRIYPILKQWLDVPIPPSEYHNVRPDAELMAMTPEIAAERKPKTTAELALPLAGTRLERARRNPSALRAALAAKLGDIEPVIEDVPITLLKPTGVTKSPVVLAFAQQGASGFLANRAPEIVMLLDQGYAVCLADVRSAGTSAAANELMLGNTLLGAQLKKARSIFRHLSRRPDIDPKKIILWGDSFSPVNPRDMLFDKSPHQPGGPSIPQAEPLGPLLALLTALYEPDAAAVATRRGLASFLSVLEDRFTYIPLDAIVPGVLEAGDIPDIAAAIAPRPVLMHASIDGRNRPLTSEPDNPAAIVEWIIERGKLKLARDFSPAKLP